MRRTLLITMDYIPSTGGIAVYWSSLAKYFNKENFFILIPGKKKDLEKNNSSPHIIKCPFFFFFWPHWLPLLFSVARSVKNKNIETAIAAQILPVGTVCFILKKVKILKSYFISSHGMDLAILKGWKKKLAQKILQQAEKVIVNSDFTAGLVQSLKISPNKVYKINPCPNNLPQTDFDIYQEHHIKKDIPILLTVCRLVKRKGIDQVIKSLPEIWKHQPLAVYMVVGDGPDKIRLQELVEKYIPEKHKKQVIFVGRVSDENLSAYYLAANIFIMPTKQEKGDIEGFGIVYLEAGLFELPVIATEVGGVAEAVIDGQTGLLLPSNDNMKIVQAVIKLMQNDLYQKKLGQGNYNWAKSFRWENQADKLKQLLQ